MGNFFLIMGNMYMYLLKKSQKIVFNNVTINLHSLGT